MKFYGNGAVWDTSKSKIIARFKDGEFETSDKYIIEYLTKMNYKHDEVSAEIVVDISKSIEHVKKKDKVQKEYTVTELRELAKAKGAKGVFRKSKEELINMIEGD